LQGQRQAEDGRVHAIDGGAMACAARTLLVRQHPGQDRRHHRHQHRARRAVEHEALRHRRMGKAINAAAGSQHQGAQHASFQKGPARSLHMHPVMFPAV
jgi:hypothetical protein